MTSCLPFHKKAADEFGGDQLGGAGEEGLGEMVWELLERSWWLWEWLESGRIHPDKEENENRQKEKMSSQSRELAAKGALVLWAASLVTIPVIVEAGDLSIVEHFNCGTLGRVTLRSSKPSFSKKAGHTVSAATISIPLKGIKQSGILHIYMGGNDRIFTRQESDSFSSVDDTSTSNPVMMQARVGSFFYGKKREEVTVVLMKEAYTCIPD